MLKLVFILIIVTTSQSFAEDYAVALDKLKEACLSKGAKIGLCDSARAAGEEISATAEGGVDSLKQSAGMMGEATLVALNVVKMISDQSVNLTGTIRRDANGIVKITPNSFELGIKVSF